MCNHYRSTELIDPLIPKCDWHFQEECLIAMISYETVVSGLGWKQINKGYLSQNPLPYIHWYISCFPYIRSASIDSTDFDCACYLGILQLNLVTRNFLVIEQLFTKANLFTIYEVNLHIGHRKYFTIAKLSLKPKLAELN